MLHKEKLNFMSDDKSVTTRQDRDRVDSKDASEVEYVHSQFPELEHEQVVEAIEKEGPLRKDIYEYLKKTYRV